MDAALEWKDDFAPDATGDLQMVDGDDETRQRLERRLFTPVNGYVWHKDYGAGLPQKVGSVLSNEDIKSVVNSQVHLEQTVAKNPPVIIGVAPAPGGFSFISIQYFDSVAKRTVSFTITA
jgi:hypothetical protein